MKNIFIVGVVLMLTSCVSLNQTGDGSRYIGTAIDDNAIALSINNELLNYIAEVNVTVFDGRVMLVGTVDDKAAESEVLKKARSVEGVKEIIDYIEIDGQEKGEMGMSWVTEKVIQTKMLANESIASSNFKVVVYRKIVYIIGQASSKHEHNEVIRIIKETDDVLGVKDSIIVK